MGSLYGSALELWELKKVHYREVRYGDIRYKELFSKENALVKEKNSENTRNRKRFVIEKFDCSVTHSATRCEPVVSRRRVKAWNKTLDEYVWRCRHLCSATQYDGLSVSRADLPGLAVPMRGLDSDRRAKQRPNAFTTLSLIF